MDADDDRQHKLVVAGRILLSRTHPSAWLQSAAARNVLAKDHKFGFRTITKIRKSLELHMTRMRRNWRFKQLAISTPIIPCFANLSKVS